MSDPLMMVGARPARVFGGGARPGAVELAGRSPAIGRVHELLRRAALTDAGALITGEAGCGVESVARELHLLSRHPAAPYIVVECAGADAATVDRLLFGPSNGGPPADLESVSSESRVAAAIGGSLFLQDVTDLPAAAQARVARIARDGEVRIHDAVVTTNMRLIASALPGIDADVHAHRFRPDLYRRLTAARIDLPPLRDRCDDVPAIAARLLEDICVAEGLAPRTFTQTALALIGALNWPGNLRELHGAIGQAVTEAPAAVIQVEHLLPAVQRIRPPAPFVPTGNLREARLRFERDYIAAVLQHHGWRMADAAATLGIQRPNLYRKARQLGIPLARLSDY